MEQLWRVRENGGPASGFRPPLDDKRRECGEDEPLVAGATRGRRTAAGLGEFTKVCQIAIARRFSRGVK
jgi:hypothetical protein